MADDRKVCVTCGVEKDAVADFYLHGSKRNPTLRRSECKACRIAYVVQRQSTPEALERKRWYTIKRLYGLTKQQYMELLADQDGRCAICRTDDPSPHEFFSVDHDHRCCPGVKTCGTCVRGLLCLRCNNMLGRLEEHFTEVWEYLHVPHSGWRALSYVLTQAGLL